MIMTQKKHYELLDKHDLKQINHLPTHIKGGTLDLAIVKQYMNAEIEVDGRVTDSDHLPVKIKLETKEVNVKPEDGGTVTFRNMSKLEITELQEKIRNSIIPFFIYRCE